MISKLIEELIDNADLYTKELHDLMYRAADTIEMLSEKVRETKQEWIPCSERLPEPNKLDDRGLLKAYLVQRGSRMYTARWNGENWILWTMGTVLEGVTAWMLLPEPWKGVDSETN